VIDGFTGLHELVRDGVGLDHMRTQRNQHFANHRFAGCNATGESEFQQAGSVRKTLNREARKACAEGAEKTNFFNH
jgi:hypothetical protein